MRALAGLLLFSCCGFAGPFEIGIRGGGQLTEGFSSVPNFSDVSKRYIVGPTVGLRLPFGLGVQLDALYRKVAFRSNTGVSQPEFTASSWQFPLLVKYRFAGVIIHPFLEAGPVFHHLSDITISGTGPDTGVVFGGGVEIKLGKMRLSPEVRYTRWGGVKSLSPTQLWKFNQNQADGLVGITF
jgi:hypothetical protein